MCTSHGGGSGTTSPSDRALPSPQRGQQCYETSPSAGTWAPGEARLCLGQEEGQELSQGILKADPRRHWRQPAGNTTNPALTPGASEGWRHGISPSALLQAVWPSRGSRFTAILRLTVTPHGYQGAAASQSPSARLLRHRPGSNRDGVAAGAEGCRQRLTTGLGCNVHQDKEQSHSREGDHPYQGKHLFELGWEASIQLDPRAAPSVRQHKEYQQTLPIPTLTAIVELIWIGGEVTISTSLPVKDQEKGL